MIRTPPPNPFTWLLSGLTGPIAGSFKLIYAGAIAGIISRSCCAPLEMVSTLMMCRGEEAGTMTSEYAPPHLCHLLGVRARGELRRLLTATLTAQRLTRHARLAKHLEILTAQQIWIKAAA